MAPQSPFEESATTSASVSLRVYSSRTYFYWLVIFAGETVLLEKMPSATARENDPETLRFPYRNRCKSPFFECSFHEITIEFLLELVQKADCKKLNRQTDVCDVQTESSRS